MYSKQRIKKPEEVIATLDFDGQYTNLIQAFKDNSTVLNLSQQHGDYLYSLLAIVSGKNLRKDPIICDGEILNDRSYLVAAIIPLKEDSILKSHMAIPRPYISPLINGYSGQQLNLTNFASGTHGLTCEEGYYILLETANLTMYANRGVQIAIYDKTPYPSADAYDFDQITGRTSPRSDSTGLNIIFDLPLNPPLNNP
ncbi:hypothetical protein [Pelistega sp. MC2]|uniref:hypothetical protein n=1 Tax=Pelistega sp. MC2 TaxID=1720297 RepID=UPI0008D8E4CF|nr:hypothetical protein [Pelistega sp. MC2]